MVRAGNALTDATTAHLTKGDETPPTLVPKHEAHAAEALKQRESAHVAKLGMVAERSRQAVIRNAAAQVVDMVHADIRREPAQDARQVVIRASVQGGGVTGPFAVMGPECLLKLVLHVEQPHPGGTCEQHDG